MQQTVIGFCFVTFPMGITGRVNRLNQMDTLLGKA